MSEAAVETKRATKKLHRKNDFSDACLELNTWIFWMGRNAYWADHTLSKSGKHAVFSAMSQHGGGVPNYFTPIVDTKKLKNRYRRAKDKDEFLKLLAADFYEEMMRVAQNLTKLADAIFKEFYDREHVDLVDLRIEPLPYDDKYGDP